MWYNSRGMGEVLFLAVLQGVAEFLPISSSGHLVLAQSLFGGGECGMRLEVCLHAGTLLSVVAFYRKTIARLLGGCFAPGADAAARKAAWLYAAKIVAGSLPAVAVYFLLKRQIDGCFESARFTGCMLVFTGAVLTATRFLPRGGRPVGFATALLMGLGQAAALLPGVSRSGMTLACARAAKAGAEESAEFSFLMCAPLIAGGLILEIAKGAAGEAGEAAEAAALHSWPELAAGAAVAAVVGWFALKFLVATLKGRGFWLFGPYCVLAGAATLIFA